jgi:DNA-binding NarL/FixJ family response regulator
VHHERRGEFDRALEALQASAEVARSQRAVNQLGRTLATTARVARLARNLPLAASADAELAAVIRRIGPEVHGLAWASGISRPGRSSTAAAGPLTWRERDVAALLAEGRTNRQIAEQLVISERTAEHHVQSILNKLGLASRAQVAGWAASIPSTEATEPEPAAQ